jgi:hypothetical protein
MTSRRALLASFLAAPVAVRLGRWVKPGPMSDAEVTAALVVWYEKQLRKAMVAMLGAYENARIDVTRQMVDAYSLATPLPSPWARDHA